MNTKTTTSSEIANLPEPQPASRIDLLPVAQNATAGTAGPALVPAAPLLAELSPESRPHKTVEFREQQHLALIQHRVTTIESSTTPAAHPVPCIAQLPSHVQRRASRPHVRNGKIARLPKLERDMVNRMLYNNMPYCKIVGALDECNITATQRNISNWKTRGGYQEWCDEQERQLQLSHLQDHLTDYLRKNNATQLPEVGLQVAATQLSLTLLQPDAARQLAADPQKYSQVVDMLCRLSTHINTLQKDREDAVRKAAIRDTSEFIRREDEKEVESIRSSFTTKYGNSARDPEIPHRNDLPRRDELPYREPLPKQPSFLEILNHMNKTGRLPAPNPKP